MIFIPEKIPATITGLALDSRQVQPGTLFFAIPGSKINGLEYIPKAIQAGASAVVVPEGTGISVEVPIYTSSNIRRDVALAAAHFYQPAPPIQVAVTGTNGKTSVAQLFQQLWTRAKGPAAAIGTMGITTPAGTEYGGLTSPDAISLHQTLQQLAENGIEAVAMEASSHGLHQHRVDGLQLQAAAFTNLSRDHLDYHGTIAAYLAAKERLFTEVLSSEGVCVFNVDDPAGATLAAINQRRVIAYGNAEAADLRIIKQQAVPGGQQVIAKMLGEEHTFTVPLYGNFQVYNVLAAMGLAMGSGAKITELLPAIPLLKNINGRLENIDNSAIFVDFAHTPDALENALQTLRDHTNNQLAVVFGCGGDRDNGKRPLMGQVAAKLADYVIVTDDNPRTENPSTVRQQVLAGCPEATEIGDRREAIAAAVEWSRQTGGLVLVAGKGHETGQIVGTETLPFSDQVVVRECLSQLSS